jgi:hypothetical protein
MVVVKSRSPKPIRARCPGRQDGAELASEALRHRRDRLRASGKQTRRFGEKYIASVVPWKAVLLLSASAAGKSSRLRLASKAVCFWLTASLSMHCRSCPAQCPLGSVESEGLSVFRLEVGGWRCWFSRRARGLLHRRAWAGLMDW